MDLRIDGSSSTTYQISADVVGEESGAGFVRVVWFIDAKNAATLDSLVREMEMRLWSYALRSTVPSITNTGGSGAIMFSPSPVKYNRSARPHQRHSPRRFDRHELLQSSVQLPVPFPVPAP